MNTSPQEIPFEWWWALGVGVFASLLLVVGPVQVRFPNFEVTLNIISMVLTICSAWRLRHGLPSSMATWALALLAAGLMLIGLQLIPLPYGAWSSMPGRQFLLDTFIGASIGPSSRPLTVDPLLTRGVVAYILPSIALFFASLSLVPQHRRTFAYVMIIAAVLCALLGLVQRFQGVNSIFYLFDNPAHDNSAKGTFLNRNFFAAQLYCTVPFVAALAVSVMSGKNFNRFVVTLMLFIYFLTLMAALGASGSRGGLGLAMLAVLLSSALAWSGRNHVEPGNNIGKFLLPMVLLLVLLVAQFGLVGLLRITQTDSVNDLRAIMARTTVEAIMAFFPFGSGFGSFVPVYRLFEKPDDLLPEFINNAHNDWLQLALEGGLPMILLMLGFVIWYLVATYKIWRHGTNSIEDLLLRSATLIVLLLLLHSIIDYPLRTRALMGLFAVCCGLLASGVHIKPARLRMRRSENLPVAEPAAPKPARSSPYFVKKD